FSSRRLHTRSKRDWSSDVCSSDLARDAVCLPDAANRSPVGASRPAQAAQRIGRTELAAVVDPGPGQFFEGGWCFARRRNRLEPRIFALRLSGGCLFRVAPTVPAGALRAARSLGHGAKTWRAIEHRAQDP